jgi:hypothetical protein
LLDFWYLFGKPPGTPCNIVKSTQSPLWHNTKSMNDDKFVLQALESIFWKFHVGGRNKKTKQCISI